MTKAPKIKLKGKANLPPQLNNQEVKKKRSLPQMPWSHAKGRKQASIVPSQNIAGHALICVIAIMTFLSCLTLGMVTLVYEASLDWKSQISREATIQIRPSDDFDMNESLQKARNIAAAFDGVQSASIIDRDATTRLLEPWLGSGLDIDELPVPRLVIVTIDENNPPNFLSLRRALEIGVPQSSLDDHRTWVNRLVSMAQSTVTIGFSLLLMMLAATVLTVVFATRGAMAGNGHIIEVLHFVGAQGDFIARSFRQHFLLTGLKGAILGGIVAIGVFLIFGWWSARNFGTPQGDQATALFGNFSIGAAGYGGVIIIVMLISFLTALTTHITVLSHLAKVDNAQ